MIEKLEGLGPGALGFVAKGEVTGEDYERVLVPAIESALEGEDRLSLLYVLGDEFDGYEAAAMWEDTKVGMKHISDWERIGVVTDHDAYARMVRGFGFLIPAEVRVFPTAELEDAKTWVGDGEPSG